MENTYNKMRFEEVATELTMELNKMTVPELQEFKEEWYETIQAMPPKVKNFCDSLVDTIISIKEGFEE